MSTDAVAVLGTAMTDMSRRDLQPDQLALQVIAEAMADSGVGAGDLSLVVIANASGGRLYLGTLSARAQDRPILVLGVEKMWTGDRAATLEAIESGLPADYRADMHERLAEHGNPAGSILMGLNAWWADKFIEERGATVEQIAAAAVKARRNGSLNPLAQCQQAVTMDEVLGSAPIAGVLTRFMCSSFTDGAAALVKRWLNRT